MAYIGRSVDIGMFEKQVLTPDSSTTTFTLTYAVGSANSLLVVYGGVVQEPQVAYSVSGGGQSIAFSEAPATGTTTYIIYLGKQLTTPRAAGQETTKQTFAGDGSTVTFTLTDPPVVPAGIMVFVDGILQREGSGNNYVSSGSTITFSSAPDTSAEIDVYTLVKEKVSIDTVADGSITVQKLAASHPTWDGGGNFVVGGYLTSTSKDNTLSIANATDTTKIAQFSAASVTTGTTAVFTLPAASATLAGLGTTQTFTATNTFSGNVSMTSSSFTRTATTQAWLDGSMTTAAWTVGGTAQTGAITMGRSTVNQTINIGTGATTAVSTKAIIIGSTGVSGSTTTITSGSSTSGALVTHTWNAGATSMTLDSSGNLGIGGTTPASNPKLSLYGGIRFLSTETAAATYTGIGCLVADNVSISTAGSERMRIDSSGNVGIGTASPAVKLHVTGTVGFNTNSQTVPTPDNGSVPVTVFTNNYSSGSGESSIWNTGASLPGGVRLMQVTGSGTYNDMAWFQKNTALFYTSNTERMRIDSSGNVGIGTTSPAAKLEVVGASAVAAVVIKPQGSIPNNNDNSGLQIQHQGTGGAAFRVRTDAAVTATQFAHILVNNASAAATALVVDQYGTSPIASFTKSGTAAFHITNIGDVCIGKTAAATSTLGTYFAAVGGDGSPAYMYMTKTFSGTRNGILFYHNSTYTGGIDFTNTTTALTTSSDVRLKKDIVDAPSAIAKVNDIHVVSHGWKHDEEKVKYGFIAQELFFVAPEAVTKGDDGEEVEKPWGVNYAGLVPMLVKSVQELKAIVDAQAVEIAALKVK